MIPWSLGAVEDVRRGMRVEREGRRRSVVLNMLIGDIEAVVLLMGDLLVTGGGRLQWKVEESDRFDGG